MYPSYVFVYMTMTQKAHNILINTDHVINFIGRDHGVCHLPTFPSPSLSQRPPYRNPAWPGVLVRFAMAGRV